MELRNLRDELCAACDDVEYFDHITKINDLSRKYGRSILQIYTNEDPANYNCDGRVESKWGTLGLFNHAKLEVPAGYGEMLRFFEPLDYEVAIEHFCRFAKENGAQCLSG